MARLLMPILGASLAAAAIAVPLFMRGAEAETAARTLPAPLQDTVPAAPGLQTAVFAGGCFWGIQGVFQHVAGVTQAVSGYAGGTVADPSYDQVSTGATGHAEVVRVTFDPAQVSYGTLLHIFFTVALDPTQVNRQGPDRGTQYRSALFADNAEQGRVARAYLAQLEAAHVFGAPIATKVGPAAPFYPAEAYHQDYLQLHPTATYIAIHDMPKVRQLAAAFPANWRGEPVRVGQLATAAPRR